MITRLQELTAKVAAVNKANAYALELYDKLAPLFTPLAGKQIFKATGEFLAKVQKLLPELPCTVPLSVYRRSSDYMLAWTVKTCESIPPHSCTYHETTVYVGTVHHYAFLTEIAAKPDLRTDYTVEEILAKRETFAAARKIADEAKSALHPFGEGD
jgi:hypothetical protein